MLSMNTTDIRPLVEGALLAAIAVVLIMLGMYVPVLGAVVVFLWPVPVVVIYLRRGIRIALMTVAVAGLALATLFGPLQALLTVVSFGTLGLAFGYGIRRNMGGPATLLLGTVSVLASLMLSVVLSSAILNINIFETFIEGMEQSTKMAGDLYSRMGLGEEATRALESFQATIPAVRLLLPGIMIAAALINSTLNYQVTRGVLRRLGHDTPALPAFAYWRLPSGVLIGFAAVLGLVLVTQYYALPQAIERIATNLLFVMGLAFSIHGLALLYWFMSRWELAKWFRVTACAFIVLSPVFPLMQWAGVIDVIIDLRAMVADRLPRPPATGEE